MHEVENMFSARVTPWHGLGTVTADCLTAEAAMIAGGLDWTVEKHPIQSVVVGLEGVSTVDIPGRYATIRTNPATNNLEALGVVGEDYTVVQNIQHADFLNTLVDESGAHFETAGSLRGGKHVFVTMKMPNTVQVAGVDPIDLYLVARGSHDGSTAFTVMVTPVRVVCMNTLNYALTTAPNKINLRHTSGVMGRIQEVRNTLDLTFTYMAEFEAMAEAMLAKPISVPQFDKITDALWKPTTTAAGETAKRTQDRKDVLRALYTKAATQEVGRGTAWGALNAITEYTDWFAPESGSKSRALRVADGSLDDIKARALRVLARA